MWKRGVLLLAFLAAAAWRSGTESCQQDARLPEGEEDLESLIRQLNHSAPSPLQLWTTLVTELLTAAGCESRVAGQPCDARQLCEQLSQHAVASIHRLRRAPEVMEFVTTGFDPIVTQVHPGASMPGTNGEETDQQESVPGTGPTANGQQKYDDPGKWAPVRALSSSTLLDGTRRKRSPFGGESPDYLYLYADDIPRDLVPRDYDDVAGAGGGSGLSPRFPPFPRHSQQGGNPQLPPHPQTSWWLQQDMMSNWPNGPAAAPGLQETQGQHERRRVHGQRHGFVGHLDQMSPHAHPHSGSDIRSDGAVESRSVMKQQQPLRMENIRRRTDNRHDNKLVPREHDRGRQESEPRHHSERTVELTPHSSVVTANVLTVTEAKLQVDGMVHNSGSSPSPLETAAVRTTRASETFRNVPHQQHEGHSNAQPPDPDNHHFQPNHPVNDSEADDHIGPGTPFEHDVTSGQLVTETAARILFAVLHAEESSCERLSSAGLDPQRWVDGVCRPMSRRDKRSEMGGDDDDDNNVRSVNTNIEDSVQRAIQSLEAKMVAALARWNPAHILGKVWTGLSDEAFLQHQQCFHIRREVASAKDAMHPVSAGVCHLELWNFLKRLTSTVLYKLLRGQRPITEDVPCQMDFVSDMFNKYGTRERPAGCTMTQSISLQGIENILTDARSLPGDNNMTTTQSSAGASLASGLSRTILEQSTVSKNFSAQEIVGFVFPTHTGVFSVQQFYQMCPVILQQVTMVRQPFVKPNDAAVDLQDLKKVTVIEATGIQSYGLGTASVAVITLCSFVGAVLVRMCRGLGHHYAMAAMLALAFGNLCGDAVLHLLPKALEPHDSAGSSVGRTYTLPGNVRVDVSVVKGFCLLFSVYVFWLLELFTSRYYRHQQHTKKDVCPDTAVKSRHQDIDPRHRIPMSDMREEMEMTMQTNQMTAPQTSSYEIISARPVYPSKTIVMEVEENVVTSVHLVWMIVVGDVIHNLADGLAIGAAFSHSLPLGLCTSLAVVCHELPHELGDFAILLSTGMPMKRALLLNVLTGLAAFVGLYTGVALGSDHLQRQWVLMSVAGMFLYVSLADLVPELVQYFRLFQNVRMFLVQNLGLLSGFALMFGLVLLEDKMRFLPEKITAHT